jgi:Abortive infection alpha
MTDKNNIQVGLKISPEDKTISAGIQGDQDAVNKFFDGIIPDFVKDGAGILSDQVKLWRWTRQIDIIKKAQVKIESSGLSKRQIPLKVLVPIIQNSSLEEDSNMQNKWANLLANAATGNVDVSPNYAAILNELSPLEVSILDKVYFEVNKELNYEKRREIQFDSSKLKSMFSIQDEKMDLVIENLYRLNLFQSPAGRGATLGNFPFALRTTKIFEFTTLGYEFVKACS